MAQYDDRSLRPRHILLGWLLIMLLLAAPAPLRLPPAASTYCVPTVATRPFALDRGYIGDIIKS